MSTGPGLQELREKYLALNLYIKAGRGPGHGQRLVFLRGARRGLLDVYDAGGRPWVLQLSNIELKDVQDVLGNSLTWRIDTEVHRLDVRVDGKWQDVCLWRP